MGDLGDWDELYFICDVQIIHFTALFSTLLPRSPAPIEQH